MSYGVFVDTTSCAPKFRFELNRDHPKRMKLKHDGASWGNHKITLGTRGIKYRHHNLMGKRLKLQPRGDPPPHIFLLRSCSSFPTGRCRQATPRRQQQRHDGVSHGSRAIHRGQGVSIKPFGVTPLSLMYPPTTRIRERGGIYPDISRIYPRKTSRN